MMMRASTLFLCLALLPLAACNEQDKAARISTEKTMPAPTARSEPVFFNGKTYQFDITPRGQGGYDLGVSGMSAKQEKDAVQLATSSMRYFACPDGKSAHLIGKPSYAGGKWKMAANCA